MSVQKDDADLALRLGYDLEQQRGRGREAEDAYRRAVAGGRSDAWLYLGALLSWQRGREREAQAAFEAAMDAESPELRCLAALELGEMLDRLHGDRGGARAYYERALPGATGRSRVRVLLDLAYLAAEDGRREEARSKFHEATTALVESKGVDLSPGTIDRIARAFTTLAARHRSGRALRRHRARMYWLRRLRRRLVRRVRAGRSS